MDDLEINVNFDIENYVYRSLRTYLTNNSQFIDDPSKHIFSKAPKTLTNFPTVVFRETNNRDGIRSLDRSQRAYQITNTIEIYTTDLTIDGVRYTSKAIMSELKYLVFDFFENLGASRLSCEPAEYSDHQVDRLVITERYNQVNWSRKII